MKYLVRSVVLAWDTALIVFGLGAASVKSQPPPPPPQLGNLPTDTSVFEIPCVNVRDMTTLLLHQGYRPQRLFVEVDDSPSPQCLILAVPEKQDRGS